MNENCNQDAASGIVKNPCKEYRSRDGERGIDGELLEIERTKRNRTRGQHEDGQMPERMHEADDHTG